MNDLLERLQNVFRSAFDDEGLVLENATTAHDIEGWDSMMHINLIIGIEKCFHIKFATAEISALKGEGQNIGTLVRLIERKLDRGRSQGTAV